MIPTQLQSCRGLIGAITERGLCSGCGLCESLAPEGHIEMRLNASGYLRPIIQKALSDDDERYIAQACPGVQLCHEKKDTRQYHTIWGPLMGVSTGYSCDAEMRHQGSSGGVLSALAAYLLASGEVSFVAQIAVSHRDPLANELQISRTRDDVLRAAGSRYAPSAPLRSIRALLDTGERFAIIGKPCDVGALRQYARMDARVSEQIPYMLSFMCAGVPSMKGTLELLERMGTKRELVASLRYRGDGWPGMTSAIQKDGNNFEMDYATSWGTILNRYLQFRCKVCPDGTGECADIVCGDAWHGKNGYPDFSEKDGRSLILLRTAQGDALLKKAVADSVLLCTELSVTEIAAMQPYQVSRKRLVLGRLLAARCATGVTFRYDPMRLIKASLQANPFDWLRSACGTYRRATREMQ